MNTSYDTIEPETWREVIADFDETFWHWRQSLEDIYSAAITRMTSPWAVLAHCAARALAIVPPGITLPPIVGGPGSLNSFSVIVTPSGGGKGAAESVAEELTAARCGSVPVRNLGSGEGLIETYLIPGDKKNGIDPQRRQAVHFSAAEIDALTVQGGRGGTSTLLYTLRNAFSGEKIGASTIRSGGLELEKHSYRLTLTVSAQPARCATLLADADGGTPQRFMWFPGSDIRVRAHLQSSDPLPPLTLPSATAWPFDHSLTIPDLARDLIVTAAERRHRIEPDAATSLDGHALFAREKFAYALAVLDGRTEMNGDDWMLSEFAADVSVITRNYVQDVLADADHAAADRLGRLQAITGIARKSETFSREEQRVSLLGMRVLRYLKDGPLTRNQVAMKFGSHERTWLDQALGSMAVQRFVELGADGKYRLPEVVADVS